MSSATTPDLSAGHSHGESRLAHLPVALFSIVMGMAGLAIAWMKAHHVAGLPALPGDILR